MQPLESRCKRPDLLLMKESEARGPEGIFSGSHRTDGSNNTATGPTGSTLFEILAFAREFREHSTHAVQPSRSLGKLSPHLRTVAPRIFDSSASTIPCPCEQNDRSFYQNQKQSNLFIKKLPRRRNMVVREKPLRINTVPGRTHLGLGTLAGSLRGFLKT